MSNELKLQRLRELARASGEKEGLKRQKNMDAVVQRITELAKLHLPEWMRVIERAIAVGRTHIRYEMKQMSALGRWQEGNSSPKILIDDVSSGQDAYARVIAFDRYESALQALLGVPFTVQVYVHKPGDDYSGPDDVAVNWSQA